MITINGRQKWHTVRGSKRDAQKELTRLLKSQDDGTYTEPSRLTVREYLDRWLKDFCEQACAPRTTDHREGLIRNNLGPLIGHVPLGKLTALHIQGAYTELSKRLSARTVHHAHRMLKQALKQAIEWNMLAINPCDRVKPPKPQKSEMKVLDGAQLAQLLDQTKDSRLRIPIMLAATAGLRRGECLALRWSDIDLSTGQMQVTRSLEETSRGLRLKGTKSGKGRTVALMGTAVEALKHHRAEQGRVRLATGKGADPEQLVNPGADGGLWRPSSLGAAYTRMLRRKNLPSVTFHQLRHSHATLGLAAGVPAKIMQERLGHASIAITMDIYSHALPNMQADAAEAMERALSNAAK